MENEQILEQMETPEFDVTSQIGNMDTDAALSQMLNEE
jgi:hypothetical protein